jgi:hypothetical protein
MIRFYKWGDDVPKWIVGIRGEKIPSVTFNGLVLVYRFKGKIILKHLFGKSIIKITNGYKWKLIFINTVMKQKSSPLNILRRIKCITKGLKEGKQ